MLLLRLIDRCYPVSNVDAVLGIKKCKSLIFIVLKDNIWKVEWAKPCFHLTVKKARCFWSTLIVKRYQMSIYDHHTLAISLAVF